MTVPKDIATKVLFLSNRVCCVCRIKGKPTQIHHIDGDDTNNDIKNLAVLCLNCHNETQIRGGFHRKLDPEQIILFRDDWYSIVSTQRATLAKPSIVEEERQGGISWKIFGPKSLPNSADLKLKRIKSFHAKFIYESWMLDMPIHFPIKFKIKNNEDETINLRVEIFSTTKAILFSPTEPIKKLAWRPIPHYKTINLSLKDTLEIEVSEKGQTTEFTFDAIYSPQYLSLFSTRAVLNYRFDGITPSGTKFSSGPRRIEILIA